MSSFKEKRNKFSRSVLSGLSHSDSLAYTLRSKSLPKRMSLVALKLGSLESEAYSMCAMGWKEKSTNSILKELQRFRHG